MFFVVAASYDNVLYGYQISTIEPDTPEPTKELDIFKTHEITAKEGFSMKLIFLHKAHTSCVRCLTSFDGLLISGSDDESVKVYNLYKRREEGTLLEHQGSVGCAEILGKYSAKIDSTNGRGWVVTSGGDGKIILWRTKDWRSLLSLKGSRASPNNYSCLIAPHPTARLVLSLSPNGELKMWNLINGKCAYRRPIPNTTRKAPLLACAIPPGERERAISLKWSPNGKSYSILFPSHIAVYNPEDGELITIIEEEFPLIAIEYLNDELMAVVGESTSICFYNANTGIKTNTIKDAHRLRVKGIDLVDHSFLIKGEEEKEKEKENLPYLISASSDGTVKVWDLNKLEEYEKDPTPICCAKTESRLTCITASGSLKNCSNQVVERNSEDLSQNLGKRKNEEDGVNEGDDESIASNIESKTTNPKKRTKLRVIIEGDTEIELNNKKNDKKPQQNNKGKNNNNNNNNNNKNNKNNKNKNFKKNNKKQFKKN